MGLRIGQILDVAPDFIEIITWNDVSAGLSSPILLFAVLMAYVGW